MGSKIASDEAFSDGTMAVDVLGDETKVRIIFALISEADRDLNATEIISMAGISHGSFYNHIDTLRKWGIVNVSRRVSNSKMYEIDQDSKAAEALAEFEWALVKYYAEREKDGKVDENNRPILEE